MTQEISPFEKIRRTNPAGNEFWSSRDFAKILGYTDYRNFEAVIEKARTACFNSGQRVDDHFVEITEMIGIGKGGQRTVKTVMMSRYACYRREKIVGKDNANRAHHEVGAKVRQTIRELGGTMPENLPAAESIASLEAKTRKALKSRK